MGEVVELLQARRALDAFGAVHMVCNNSSAAIGGPVWTHTVEDWQWVLGVNLRSVIHGVRVFIPIVLAPPPRPRQGCSGVLHSGPGIRYKPTRTNTSPRFDPAESHDPTTLA